VSPVGEGLELTLGYVNKEAVMVMQKESEIVIKETVKTNGPVGQLVHLHVDREAKQELVAVQVDVKENHINLVILKIADILVHVLKYLNVWIPTFIVFSSNHLALFQNVEKLVNSAVPVVLGSHGHHGHNVASHAKVD